MTTTGNSPHINKAVEVIDIDIDDSPADLSPTGLSDLEIQQLVNAEIKTAKTESDALAPNREKRWDRYRGKPLGNEVNGRSKFVSRDVMDAIEATMPYLMRTFATGDPKIELTIDGVDTLVSDALMEQISDDLSTADNNLFKLLYIATKDALVSDTGYIGVTWDRDIETSQIEADGLTPEQYAELVTREQVEILQPGEPMRTPQGLVYHGIVAKVTKINKDELSVYNIPTWSMLYDPSSDGMHDDKPKGIETEVTIDYLKRINRSMSQDSETDYFDNLDELMAGSEDPDTNEEVNYFNNTATTRFGGENQHKTGPGRKIKLVEWYTRIDVDDDGYLDDVRVWVANGKLIRWELNEDGSNPFVAVKPIINPYKFNGTALSELLIEVQNLNTMLTRRILDSFDYANSGRWVVDPEAGIDRRALRFNTPGAVIAGKVDGVKNLSPAPFNPGSLSILDYVKSIKEERSGINGSTQGIASPGLANSAKETVAAIQSAAMQRLELIARTMLETGLTDFYKKVVQQYQKNLRSPITAKIKGQDVDIPVDMIQGRVKTKVVMGASATVGGQESTNIERIANFILGLNEKHPGLAQPKEVHTLASRFIKSLGFRNPDVFISSLPEFEQAQQQNQQKMQELQQSQAQAQKAHEQAINALAARELDIQSDKAKADALLKHQANTTKDQDSQRDFILGLSKLKADDKKLRIDNGLKIIEQLNNHRSN